MQKRINLHLSTDLLLRNSEYLSNEIINKLNVDASEVQVDMNVIKEHTGESSDLSSCKLNTSRVICNGDETQQTRRSTADKLIRP